MQQALDLLACLIIKNKSISIKKSVLFQVLIRVGIIMFVLFGFVSKAFASESFDQNLILGQSNEQTSVLWEEVKTPAAVSDPKEIEKAVEFASNATGVRKDFLMGMLVVESDLGRNFGKCTYGEVEKGAEQSHLNGNLSSKAWETFKQRRNTISGIAGGLGYDYKSLKVSCNPGAAYAGTGGAMGIAQFMPDIWMAYKDRIAAIVGKENPDPWNAKDGVVAMALLVSDTPGVTGHSMYAERNAAKMYLSGTTSGKYEWYANQIFYWAANYRSILG